MATKTYLCPKCGNHIELDDQALKAMGDSVVCANCQSVLKIEGDYAYVPLPQEHETAPAETPPFMATPQANNQHECPRWPKSPVPSTTLYMTT